MDSANVAKSDTPEGDFHEPADEAFACIRLELWRPELESGEPTKAAWELLRSTRRQIGQAVQRGFGDLVVHIRNLRAAGKSRFAVPSERSNAKLGVPLPTECYADEDLKPVHGFLTNALRESGVSEYVYASVARKIANSELAGEKLKGLFKGDATYPTMRNVAIMMRARNWRLVTNSRIANGKEYVDVSIEMSALRPGAGKVTLHCASLHGPKLTRNKNLLKAIAAMGLATEGEGWSKGALSIMPVRRPGQPEKWFILLPYSAPREKSTTGGPVVAVHRSVAAMLTIVTDDGASHQFSGRDIVSLKHQMYARRRFLSRDLAANPHKGRGVRRHYKALARLSDAERRATETNLWRAARWVQNTVERLGARLVLLDDFTSFDPDTKGPPFEPYVRKFPLAELKLKIIDALTRRGGFAVQEIKASYLSQRCPACQHTGKENIKKLPVARGVDVENGFFVCVKCRFSADLDIAAATNMLIAGGYGPSSSVEVKRQAR